MWEWRIFFKQGSMDKNSSYSKIQQLLKKVALEKRTDYYYDLQTPSLGLKERGPVNSSRYTPKLELKIRLQTRKNGFELWEKIIKIPINYELNESVGFSRKKLVEYLDRFTIMEYSIEIDKVIEILKNNPIKRLTIYKERKQKYVEGVYLELTSVIFQGERWETIEVESASLKSVELFLKRYPFTNIIPMNYPEFLLQK